MAEATLETPCLPRSERAESVETFRRHDEQLLRDAHHTYTDEERMIYLTKRAAKELEEVRFNDNEAKNQLCVDQTRSVD